MVTIKLSDREYAALVMLLDRADSATTSAAGALRAFHVETERLAAVVRKGVESPRNSKES